MHCPCMAIVMFHLLLIRKTDDILISETNPVDEHSVFYSTIVRNIYVGYKALNFYTRI